MSRSGMRRDECAASRHHGPRGPVEALVVTTAWPIPEEPFSASVQTALTNVCFEWKIRRDANGPLCRCSPRLFLAIR